MGEGADIVRVCLWNPASGQAQIASEFPAPALILISIYTVDQIFWKFYSPNHYAVSLMTGPQPLPKRVLRRV